MFPNITNVLVQLRSTSFPFPAADTVLSFDHQLSGLGTFHIPAKGSLSPRARISTAYLQTLTKIPLTLYPIYPPGPSPAIKGSLQLTAQVPRSLFQPGQVFA